MKTTPKRLTRYGAAFAALLVATTLLLPTSGAQASTSSGAYQNLVWSDEFTAGSVPSSSKWAYDLGGGGWGNNELQKYTANRQNVRVENGQLTIQAQYDARKKTYTSGRIKTLGKYSWQYGRVDVRAKLPTGLGSWPAIWLLPTNAKYGPDYLSNGEMDIMEEVGADQNEIFGTAHSLAYNATLGNARYGETHIATANTEFHTYSLEWTPTYLSYQVDGAEYYRVVNDNTGYKSWPFDQPFYLVLNLAVGGDWGGYKGFDPTSMPWQFAIDYVRVYQ